MYPTVVFASLRLLSNTYPPFPPFCLSAPPEGDRPSSIPESFPRNSPVFDKGLQLSVESGYVETLGEGGT